MKNKYGSLVFTKLNLLVLLNVVVVSLLFLFSFTYSVDAGIGLNNTTVITLVTVGNVYPEVLNVSIEQGDATFDLVPNYSTNLTCVGRVRDYNGDSDIRNVTAIFFDTTNANSSAAEDNNYFYYNDSCDVNFTDGWGGHADDSYTAIANCTFFVEYYSNPGGWNCSLTVYDNQSWTANRNDSITINELLALGLPDNINYGTVNATTVSGENMTNVTNYGNVQINLSLEGYAQTEGDGNAMNCSLGSDPFINVTLEQYNLSAATPGEMTFSQFDANYTNLTSVADIRKFELNYRTNDALNDAFKPTYWRIYVPRGVAGTCAGNIIFGATKAVGT